jgi:hypothetical protein
MLDLHHRFCMLSGLGMHLIHIKTAIAIQVSEIVLFLSQIATHIVVGICLTFLRLIS